MIRRDVLYLYAFEFTVNRVNFLPYDLFIAFDVRRVTVRVYNNIYVAIYKDCISRLLMHTSKINNLEDKIVIDYYNGFYSFLK